MNENLKPSLETILAAEPPDEAMIQDGEAPDFPVGCYEYLLCTGIGIIAIIASVTHIDGIKDAAVLLSCAFVALELFNLLAPPRLSYARCMMIALIVLDVLQPLLK